MQKLGFRRAVAMLFLGSLLTGCVAEEPWTRERQEQVTRLALPVPPATALKAAEQAVREINSTSVNFDYRNNGFRATRSFTEFLMIAARTGDFVYDIQISASGSGSVVETKIYSDINAITAAGVTPTGASLWQYPGAYGLLHDRIEFHAGQSATWPSCADAQKAYGATEPLDPICAVSSARAPKP